jgi:hypothetical protein
MSKHSVRGFVFLSVKEVFAVKGFWALRDICECVCVLL